MTKKMICFIVVLLLTFLGSIAVYASNLDDLDNRGDTENTAGITWDQINEMSQNSPNSLTPIQGLVLWMFAIIAFLKLAQKMDDLLQKLGLNVTQTGGRALGDLMVAGAALRNAGKLVSKGMGAIGLGGGSGGGSGSSSSGGSGASGSTSMSGAGRGPAPIPTGGPSGRTPPTSGNPSGVPSGGGVTAGHMAAGSSPSGTSASGRTQASGANANNPTSASETATTTNDAQTNNATNATAKSRNPVGRAVEWMRSDGFAQGAIRAGAKGGLIGVSAYGAKIGAAKVGSAVSAGLGGNRISSSPQSGKSHANGSGNSASAIKNQSQGNSAVNPEEFQASKPFDGSGYNTSIPTSFNSEGYQDAAAYANGGATNSDLSPINGEDYNGVGVHDGIADSQAIASSMGDVQGIDVSADTGIGAGAEVGAGGAMPFSSGTSDETWHDTASQNISNDDAPISSTNNEDWNESASAAQSESFGIESDAVTVADSGTSSAMVSDFSSIENPDVSGGGDVAQQNINDMGGYAKNSGSVNGHEVATPATPSTATAANNHSIPNELSQGSISAGSTKETPVNGATRANVASNDLATQTPIQSAVGVVGATGSKVDSSMATSQPTNAQSTQTQMATKVIRTEAPATSQTQGAAVRVERSSSEPPASQQKTMVQSHTTQINNVTKTEPSSNQLQSSPQPTSQPTSQSVMRGGAPSRPITKGKTKNPSVKGRKRNR